MSKLEKYYRLDQEIPDRMRLVDYLVDKYKADQPLKDTTAVFFQHQLGNQVVMTKALIELGLKPERIIWVDIPYTSHRRTRDALSKEGNIYFVSCDDYCLLQPYAEYQRKRAIDIYQHVLGMKYEKLLVLDDGAYFMEAASYFEKKLKHCVIVEQTSRGFKKIDKNRAMLSLLDHYPLISVANNVLKHELESPFIGKSVCAALEHHVNKYITKPWNELRCLILGFGNIGQAVAKFMESVEGVRKDNIFVHDTDNEKVANLPKSMRWNHKDNITFDIVIGCSGSTSFDFGDHVLLNDGAVLVSASSGAIEFNRRNMIEQALLHSCDDVWLDHENTKRSLHEDIAIHFPGRRVMLLNGGFPINFDSRIAVTENQHIQIAMALMVEAAVQSTRLEEQASGIQKISNKVCNDLAQLFYEDNPKDIEALPDLSMLMSKLAN